MAATETATIMTQAAGAENSVTSEQPPSTPSRQSHQPAGAAASPMIPSEVVEDKNNDVQMVGPPAGHPNAYRFQKLPQKLGSGSVKTVYLAYDTQFNRDCAWNIIPLDKIEQDGLKIENEIKTLGDIHHDRIIKYLAHWKTDRDYVFITDYYNGSLREYILSRSVNVKSLKSWTMQILEGLHFLHDEKRIVHRDIKCENIFINHNTGNVVIGDLGLARPLPQMGLGGGQPPMTMVGTVPYMAPEQLDLENRNYTAKVDIYALGMTVIEMITKNFPYQECTAIQTVLQNITNGLLPQSFNEIREGDAKDFLSQCFIKDPTQRPSAAELREHAWLTETSAEDLQLVKTLCEDHNVQAEELPNVNSIALTPKAVSQVSSKKSHAQSTKSQEDMNIHDAHSSPAILWSNTTHTQSQPSPAATLTRPGTTHQPISPTPKPVGVTQEAAQPLMGIASPRPMQMVEEFEDTGDKSEDEDKEEEDENDIKENMHFENLQLIISTAAAFYETEEVPFDDDTISMMESIRSEAEEFLHSKPQKEEYVNSSDELLGKYQEIYENLNKKFEQIIQRQEEVKRKEQEFKTMMKTVRGNIRKANGSITNMNKEIDEQNQSKAHKEELIGQLEEQLASLQFQLQEARKGLDDLTNLEQTKREAITQQQLDLDGFRAREEELNNQQNDFSVDEEEQQKIKQYEQWKNKMEEFFNECETHGWPCWDAERVIDWICRLPGKDLNHYRQKLKDELPQMINLGTDLILVTQSTLGEMGIKNLRDRQIILDAIQNLTHAQDELQS